MITLTNGQTTQEGTVICGTYRTDDLVPAFIDTLQSFGVRSLKDIAREWEDIERYMRDNPGARSLRSGDLLEELFDLLEELAPEGYYFGAHYGDGANFGWWQYEDNDNG